ncbi:MAG: hypothetical protein BSOLF_0507 [Candidatus Carbobacillus altaicus]|uniref:Uncharacterized protein n=1 Tax=Candidatus Carbonibacillus altaicus TaxID=2163959 RepID=A0A2R6Y0T1_9BACL|nr:MAG: hypothetical protein BSOLF_0507 [Candidatus Carbobacillus altaicus]
MTRKNKSVPLLFDTHEEGAARFSYTRDTRAKSDSRYMT